MDPRRPTVDAMTGLIMEADRTDLMNVDEPTEVGVDVIVSTGLEFLTAAEPIKGPMVVELELEPIVRRFIKVLPEAEP